MAAARRKLVVVEEGTLVSMASNATFLKEFPFLASLTLRIKSCGSCGSGARERASIFSAAKAAFASLDSDKKRKLKDLLNAQQVRITYKSTSNKFVQLTF